MTTIGLGDQVPDHPNFSLMAFIFFITGLALVSMCANVMHARMEAKYMAALQLVEQQAIDERLGECVNQSESPCRPRTDLGHARTTAP